MHGTAFLAVIVYVVNVLMVGNSLSTVEIVKQSIHDDFTIKDLGEIRFFLGIEVCCTSTGFMISQHNFLLDFLRDTGLSGSKPAKVPFL